MQLSGSKAGSTNALGGRFVFGNIHIDIAILR